MSPYRESAKPWRRALDRLAGRPAPIEVPNSFVGLIVFGCVALVAEWGAWQAVQLPVLGVSSGDSAAVAELISDGQGNWRFKRANGEWVRASSDGTRELGSDPKPANSGSPGLILEDNAHSPTWSWGGDVGVPASAGNRVYRAQDGCNLCWVQADGLSACTALSCDSYGRILTRNEK